MGMSPSCHCICPGAGGGGSPSPGLDSIACIYCAVAPRRWSMTVTHPAATSDACCCASYTGAFILIHGGGTGCQWETSEQRLCCIKDTGGNSCVAGLGGARMNYVITKAGATFTEQATFQFEYRFGNRFSCSVKFARSGTTLECSASRTLPWIGRTHVDLGVASCGGNRSNGGPCVEAIPAGADPYLLLSCQLDPLF